MLPQGTSCSAKSLEETGYAFDFRSHVGFQLSNRRSMGYTMERHFLFNSPSRWLAIALWLIPTLPLLANPPADRQHAIAAAHYAQGEWQLAAKAFQQFRAEFPHDRRAPAADYFRGESLVQDQQYEPALKILEQFLQNHPEHPQALRARFRAGEVAYRLGQFARAQRYLAEFREQNSGHELEAFAVPHLAAMAMDRGDAEEAASLYAEALRTFPRGPLAAECRLGLATAQEQLGNLAEAERFYRVATLSQDTPVATQAGLRLARLLTRQKEFDSALERLTLLESQTDDPRLTPHIALWKGRAYQGKGELEKAASTWWASVESSPRSELAPQLARQSATIYRQLGQLPEAEASFRWLVNHPTGGASGGHTESTSSNPTSNPTGSPRMHPWHEESLVALLEMQLDHATLADPARLLGDWQQLIVHHPQTRHGLPLIQRLGHHLLQRNQSDRLLQALDELTCHRLPDNGADSPRIAYLYALAYWSQGNHASAWERLHVGNENQLPSDLRSGFLQLRASCLFALGRFEEVIPLLEQELAQQVLDDPAPQRALPRRHLRLALALLEVGRLDDADQALEYVWRHAGHGVHGSASAQPALDEHRVAELPLPQSASVEPAAPSEDLTQIALHLAERAYKAQNYPVAARQFGRVAEHARATKIQLTARLGQAWAHFQQEEFSRAEELLNRLVAEPVTDERSTVEPEKMAETYFLLGRTLERQGRAADAIRAYHHVPESYRDSRFAADALFAEGRLLDRQGECREACRALNRLLAEYPQYARADAARYMQAWNLVELGAEEEADAVFRDIRSLHPQSDYWPDAVYRLAERAARGDDRNQARQLVDELLLHAQNSELAPQGLYLRGQLAAEEKRWNDLQRDMQRLVIQYPDNGLKVTAEYWLAEAHYQQGRHSLAADEFEKLAAVTESRQEAWVAMILLRWSQALAHANDWSTAQEVASSISSRFPDFSHQHEADYVIGRALVHEARLAKAREAFERVTNSATGRGTETAAMAQWMIGETYFHQRNYRAATQAYLGTETLYNFPRWRAAARLQLGKCHEAQQNRASAIRYYKLVIDGREDPQLVAEAERRYSELQRQEANPRSALRFLAPR